jgi:hypothetical protein
MTAFVLGNGVSRRSINLEKLQSYGPVYGCNALYREFVPHVLVATDRPIATQIQETGYSAHNRFYTRRPMQNLGAKPVPTDYYGNSSGPIACAIAALDGHRQIYMLGFDLGPDHAQSFNNMYAGTEFYKDVGTKPTFTGNWIKQITRITKDFSSVNFCRVHGDTTAEIEEFSKISNLAKCSMSDFVAQFQV